MPPANSPSETPSLSPAAPGSSSQPIAIPPPYSSATISNHSESEDAHDDNVNFLRTRMRSPPDSSLSRQRRRRQQFIPDDEVDQMQLDDTRNLRMTVEINRRIPIVRHQRDELNMPNYEGRVANVRSLYGWAPGSDFEDEDEEAHEPFQDTNTISSWFDRPSNRDSARNATPRRHARREMNDSTVPALVGVGEHTESGGHRVSESAISTAALLQSVRRQPRFSRTRTLQHYLWDRERAAQESDERERSANSTSRAYRFVPSSRGHSHRVLTHNDLRARISAHRQMHMDNPPTPRLKETIKYLERLRYSNSYAESITSAAAGGFMQIDDIAWGEDDFILETASLAPPAQCSWLRAGMVFAGSQRAAGSGISTLSSAHRIPTLPHPSSDPMIVNGSETSRISVYTTSGRRYLAQNLYSLGSGRDESWPVKVTIHNINYEDMTLSGTMEAYNIPDKTSSTNDAHIITFLEGEIIDFNTHTFETKNFKADAEIDSTYWRQLLPFRNLTDDEMIKNLVSRKWMTEELSRKWILMRWKERCFITPTDSRQGLTISGFYYITLRRDNGQIEGLYYDPGSSPYQQLSLKPETEKMVHPSYAFR